jgi:preprotein translocase subunit YajC
LGELYRLLERQYHGIKLPVKLQYVTQFSRPFLLGLLSVLFLLDASIAQTFAQAAAVPAQPGFTEVLSKMAPMFLIVFVVFHFFIIKPQKKKDAEHDELIKNLKNGDSVITSSGMIGRVTAVATDVITLEIASNVKVKFTPSSILKKEVSK